jgi:hypothetical protein
VGVCRRGTATRISVHRERRGRTPYATSDSGVFEYTTFEVGENIFKIAPIEPPIAGEYCIDLTLPMDVKPVYCFGIDPAPWQNIFYHYFIIT